ncbi:MAG: Na+/H+ antiporter subunit C [Planctomycetota bacterium]
MNFLLALAVGTLFATGLYMMLRRSLVKLIIGLGLLGHGANLLIFTSGGLVRGQAPFIGADAKTLEGAPGATFTDPLPPALILTAIVIGFAILSYAIVLARRTYEEIGSDDLDQMTSTDLPDQAQAQPKPTGEAA